MKSIKLPDKFTRSIGKMGLEVKKHSPEILVVTGVIGLVTSAVLACKSTLKAKAVLDKHKQDINTINDCKSDADAGIISKEDYTDTDYANDIKIANVHTGLELVKLYAPAVGLGVLSVTAILSGHNITRKRNLALAAAYTAVDSSFKNYRNNVVERFGEELDKELRYNVKAKSIEETVTDEETGEEKIVKKTEEVPSINEKSDYARYFDEWCTGWRRDSEYNLMFLKKQEAYANDKLKRQGYLFLNDVYDSLGIPKTRAGHCVGWVYDEKKPNGDNHVSFNIYNLHDEQKRDFVNGREYSILLDFNVDGPIIDRVKRY